MMELNGKKLNEYEEGLIDESLAFTPAGFIDMLLEHTDDNGMLFLPCWPDDGNGKPYLCKMNWTKADAVRVTAEFNELYASLEALSGKWDEIDSEADARVLPENLRKVWNTYLRDFETGDIDVAAVMDIYERLDTIREVSEISEKLSTGVKITKEEAAYFRDYRDTSVTEEERALCDRYREAVRADSQRRVGGNVAAYDQVIRAKRVCKLMSLRAPNAVLNNEARLLATAMVLHHYCERMDPVGEAEA